MDGGDDCTTLNVLNEKWLNCVYFTIIFFKKINLLSSEPTNMGIYLATSWKRTRKKLELWKWVLLEWQWWQPGRLVEVPGTSSYLVLQFKCNKPGLTCCFPILSSIVSSERTWQSTLYILYAATYYPSGLCKELCTPQRCLQGGDWGLHINLHSPQASARGSPPVGTET